MLTVVVMRSGRLAVVVLVTMLFMMTLVLVVVMGWRWLLAVVRVTRGRAVVTVMAMVAHGGDTGPGGITEGLLPWPRGSERQAERGSERGFDLKIGRSYLFP